MSFNAGSEYVSYKIDDLEEFFSQIIDPAALEKAMYAALDEIENQLKLNFQLRQQEWKQLALSTQYQRRRQQYNPVAPILVRSGTLRDNMAQGREVEIASGELRGDVYPFEDATTPYSDTPIGDYMEQLNSVREFYSLDDDQMDIVYGVFVEVLTKELRLD